MYFFSFSFLPIPSLSFLSFLPFFYISFLLFSLSPFLPPLLSLSLFLSSWYCSTLIYNFTGIRGFIFCSNFSVLYFKMLCKNMSHTDAVSLCKLNHYSWSWQPYWPISSLQLSLLLTHFSDCLVVIRPVIIIPYFYCLSIFIYAPKENSIFVCIFKHKHKTLYM